MRCDARPMGGWRSSQASLRQNALNIRTHAIGIGPSFRKADHIIQNIRRRQAAIARPVPRRKIALLPLVPRRDVGLRRFIRRMTEGASTQPHHCQHPCQQQGEMIRGHCARADSKWLFHRHNTRGSCVQKRQQNSTRTTNRPTGCQANHYTTKHRRKSPPISRKGCFFGGQPDRGWLSHNLSCRIAFWRYVAWRPTHLVSGRPLRTTHRRKSRLFPKRVFYSAGDPTRGRLW